MLYKPNPQRIKEIVQIGEGFLYRGNSQRKFEREVLSAFYEGREPAYHGYSGDNGKITFFSPYAADSFQFANKTATGGYNYRRGRPVNPNTNRTLRLLVKDFPIIFRVNASQYTKMLMFSNEGEGIVITGEINAKDIEVLFSREKDNLELILDVLTKQGHGNDILEIMRQHLTTTIRRYRLDKGGLIHEYDKRKDKPRFLKKYAYSLGLPSPLSEGATENLIKGIEYLRNKLKGG